METTTFDKHYNENLCIDATVHHEDRLQKPPEELHLYCFACDSVAQDVVRPYVECRSTHANEVGTDMLRLYQTTGQSGVLTWVREIVSNSCVTTNTYQ